MGAKIIDWIDVILTILLLTALLYFGVALVFSLLLWPVLGTGWYGAFLLSLCWPILPLLRPQDAIPAYVEMLGLDDVLAKVSDSVDKKRKL